MDRILEPETLAARLADHPDTLLIHVAALAAYANGHIDGAVHVAPAELVSGIAPATGQLPDLARLEALFSRIGYRKDVPVVAYDDEGGGWAGRFIWTLDVIGHHDWYYLDGGIHAWAASGAPLSRVPVQPRPTRVQLTLDRASVADAADILDRLGDASFVVWDCRSADEYAGRRATAARNGHIPGAVHLDWLDLMDKQRALRLRTDLAALLESYGITRDKEIVVHCQTHHRSGLAYLAGRVLGYPNVRGYHGSWSDWGNRDDTPIETGP
ncbi:MAG TPA: rhodanese-like domain-containing protein [Pseudomonadales bacterium]